MVQLTVPFPLEQMFRFLDVDVDRAFETLPMRMEEAMIKCRGCDMYHTFGDAMACRYLACPNREFLEDLDRVQGVA